MRVIIDGVVQDTPTAAISVFDWALLRGFGVFEVVRVYGEALFRLDGHLDRLEKSAAALEIPAPDRAALAVSMAQVAAANRDGQVRVILTGGGRDPLQEAAPRAVVMWEPLPFAPERIKVLPMVAPWHPATTTSGFPGVKWTSYAPNMATTDQARRLGYDDAILLTIDEVVLEGPTFSIAWLHRGRIETPSLDLGILPSITRDVVLECCARLGLPVDEDHYPIERVLGAQEVLALSTVRQVVPVERIGDRLIAGGPVATRLATAFTDVVLAETTASPSGIATS